METNANFEVGQVYSRKQHIHARYGGQRQGGISTPANAQVIFIFTGESGGNYGYRDGWDENGILHYTGEGQRGDMKFTKGNRAIRDSAKDLLVFESLGKGKGCRYRGCFLYAGHELRPGVDVHGRSRTIIVFHLIPVGDGATEPMHRNSGLPLDELRNRAYEAAKPAGTVNSRETKRLYRDRSNAVRAYVLARSNGICEACARPAPFMRQDGSAYLEAHHTRRLTDSGPDHPQWVAAICPTCHRHIHCGLEGDVINHNLELRLKEIEYAATQSIGDSRTLP